MALGAGLLGRTDHRPGTQSPQRDTPEGSRKDQKMEHRPGTLGRGQEDKELQPGLHLITAGYTQKEEKEGRKNHSFTTFES